MELDNMGDKSLKEVMVEFMKKQEEIMPKKKERKEKPYDLPFWKRLGRLKMKRGYVMVEEIGENKAITFKKVPIEDGTFKLKDKEGFTYHALEEQDIFFYKGRPFIHQAKGKLNPWRLGENEIFGQKYVAAKMMKDAIKPKSKIGGMAVLIVVLLIIGGYFIITKTGLFR